MSYYTLRIDSDPTTWELTNGIEQVPAFDAPVVLPVYHPLLGDLVLSPRSVGSVVFLEHYPHDPRDTRPDGYPIPGGPEGNGALYLPSPIGPDVLSHPPNLYLLSTDRAALQADIKAAMTEGTPTPLRVKITGGEVVINGAEVPFVVLCPPNPLVRAS